MTRRRAALASDEGTAERMAKGDLVDRPIHNHAGSVIGHGRRAQTQIEALAKSLPGPMLVAADRLRRDYELAVWRISDRERPVEPIVQRSRRPIEPTDLMIDAGRRIAAARQAMGDYTAPIVLAVVCDEVSLRQLSVSMRRNRQELLGTLKAGLDIVARCYGIRAAAA